MRQLGSLPLPMRKGTLLFLEGDVNSLNVLGTDISVKYVKEIKYFRKDVNVAELCIFSP